MSAEPSYRKRPDSIGELYVRSDKGAMIPVNALASVRYSSGPDSLDRFNNLPAVKLLGQGAPQVSSGQAIQAVERIAKQTLPPDFSYDWGGASFQEKKSSGTSALALGLAVVMVFLILAAQYEKWSLPLSVLMALPFGTFGALAAVWLRGLTNDVYFQIGLVTLLGLAAKNAILIVEYASLKTSRGSVAVGRGLGSGPAALPSDFDDLARVHSRYCAAGVLARCRRRRTRVGGHRCNGWDAGGDVPCDLLRADVLQADHRPPSGRAALHFAAAAGDRRA